MIAPARATPALPCWLAVLALGAAGCNNNPYPSADAAAKVVYIAFQAPPKTLDPQIAYTTTDHILTGNIFDTLLEYHYLDRPYRLIPGLAEAVPRGEPRPDGRLAYRFRLRADALYQDDPAFALGGAGRTTRAVEAADVAFSLMRIADPAVGSPVIDTFARLHGFRDFSARLQDARRDPAFAARPVHEQYAQAGGIAGVRVIDPLTLEIELDQPYPQIVYWFAMPFTAPMPWEAVAAYDGREGRPALADHPVGAGAYRLAHYDRLSRIVLERNANWYGVRHPEWRAPAAVYPSEGDAGDAAAGLLDPAMVGRPLPFVERIELRRDPELVPAFIKFMQGYYDETSPIISESFDRIVHDGALTADMAALGLQLEKSVTAGVYYIGFNMDDPVIGAAAGDRGRALRQAMSLAVDTEEMLRLFTNGRGISAQSPLPPGIFGYDPSYREPLAAARPGRAPPSGSPTPATPTASTPPPASRSASPSTSTTPRPARCSSSSSSSSRGSGSASTSSSPPPITTSSRTRCGAAPTSSSTGAGSPTIPIRRTFSSCSTAPWGGGRAAARTPPTSPTRATTSSSCACAPWRTGRSASRSSTRCARSPSASGPGSSCSTPRTTACTTAGSRT